MRRKVSGNPESKGREGGDADAALPEKEEKRREGIRN